MLLDAASQIAWLCNWCACDWQQGVDGFMCWRSSARLVIATMPGSNVCNIGKILSVEPPSGWPGSLCKHAPKSTLCHGAQRQGQSTPGLSLADGGGAPVCKCTAWTALTSQVRAPITTIDNATDGDEAPRIPTAATWTPACYSDARLPSQLLCLVRVRAASLKPSQRWRPCVAAARQVPSVSSPTHTFC